MDEDARAGSGEAAAAGGAMPSAEAVPGGAGVPAPLGATGAGAIPPGDPVAEAIGVAGAIDPTALADLLARGGPAIWAIAALSVLTVTLILWKAWRLLWLGAWRRGRTEEALAAWAEGDAEAALSLLHRRRGIRARVVRAAMRAQVEWRMGEAAAREETERVALRLLGEAGSGLRALELIVTIAPLLGLLGTVLGMIGAFQALEATGSRADPSVLAGGIWQALLTTAAGMSVAIPAAAALTWFEAVIDAVRRDLEDMVTRAFTLPLGRHRAAGGVALAGAA